MEKLRKYIEIAFFTAINILFSSCSIALFFIMGISGILSILLFNANPVYEDDFSFFIFCLLFILLFLVLKAILFPLLYSFNKVFPYTHKFFDKIFATKKRTFIVFLATILILIIDAFGYMFFMHENFEHTKIVALIFGPGLFPSYLIMYIYLKLKNKKQNGNIKYI